MAAPPIDPKLLGELAVVIIKAKNLPDRSKIGKHNPYVVVQYRQEKRKSKVVKKGGQHPEFDDEVRFKIYEETEDILARPSRSSDPPSSSLSSSTSTIPGNPTSTTPNGTTGEGKRLPLNKSIQVAVWADDSKEPRIVGECSVDLAEVFRTCEQDDSYELQYKGRYAGEISLELTYFINDAPPIPKKVAKPVIPAKPVHSQSITSISTIASFDGPAGFPLKGSSGSRRRPVQPTAAGYGGGYASGSVGGTDLRYQQYYQQPGPDEWGVRPGGSSAMGYAQSSGSLSTVGSGSNQLDHQQHHHRQSFSGRPTSVAPVFDPYSHQSSVDSLGGSLSSLSIASHGPSMPFPISTPYQAPHAAVHQSTFPPPTPAPVSQGQGHGHRYSMSGAIPQSSSWNGSAAVNGGNYQPPPSSSYGTLPPLPPPPSLPMPQGYSTQIPPSSSFPQLYPSEQTGYQTSYGSSTSIQPSRTPIPTDYSAQPPANPTLMPWQTSSPSQNNTSNTYQRPASTNPGSYIPPPLIDNRPPPRPSSQPMNPPVASYPQASTAYGQLPPPPPPPGGHYPLPTSSFHHSSATPAPGNYGDAQGRPLPMPAAGGYQSDPGYGQGSFPPPPPPPPPPPLLQQGDWRDPTYPVTQDPNGYQASNQGYNDYSAPPPIQQQQPAYSSYNSGVQSNTWDQSGQNNHWDQGHSYAAQPSYGSQPMHGGLAVPPPPPPRPHSPPAPLNILTNGFASRNDANQGSTTGRSYLSNLGVGDQAPSAGGGYGLPPRLPDSLLGGNMPGGY